MATIASSRIRMHARLAFGITAIVSIISLALLSFATAAVAAPSAKKEPAYVTLGIGCPQAFGSSPSGISQPEQTWDSIETQCVEQIRREFGEQHAGQERYVGFSISLIPTLNLKPNQLKAQINLALDNAERYKLPVFFHLDDEHFWWLSPELSHNPAMVEWSDFPKPGSTSGPIVPRYWLNWGDPAGVYPAPPPCFACPAFRQALALRLKTCIAEPIVQRIAKWKKEGLEYLFAGVASGNETQVADFSRAFAGYVGKPEDAWALDRTKTPHVKVRMLPEDLVPVGYHSLYAMGYDQQSILHLAQSQGKSVNRVVEELLFNVAHDYVEFQDKTLYQAGLPKERIYTHFTSTNYSNKSYDDHHESSSRAGSQNLSPPILSSVNQYGRPGFTVVRNSVDLNQLNTLLSQAHAPEDGKAWAAVESYACSGQPGTPQNQQQYEEYLGGLLAHGAKVVNVYGWNLPEGFPIGKVPLPPYAIQGAGVVPAVKKWVTGGSIPTAWFRDRQNPAIQTKVAKLHELASEKVRQTHNPHAIEEIYESLQKELDPLQKAGNQDGVEAALDRAISRMQVLR